MTEKAKKEQREIKEDSFENYRQKYSENLPLYTYNNILEKIVKTIPNKIAFIQGDRRETWKDFDAKTNRIANGLLSLGLKKGERVAISGFNSIEWMESYIGASKIGLVPVNLNPRFLEDEISYILDDSDSVVLFIEDRWIDTIEKIKDRLSDLKYIIVYNAPGYSKREISKSMINYEDFIKEYSANKPKLDWQIKNDDFCYLEYTGGTTGYPKGVVWDYWNRVGSVKWALMASMLDSGWDGIMDSVIKNPNFFNGLSNLIQNLKIPLISPLLASMIHTFSNILSDHEEIGDILNTVLKSKATKRTVLQYMLPHILGEPITYILSGGRVKMFSPSPVMHAFGYHCVFTSVCSGMTNVFMEPDQPFDARRFWETVDKERPVMIATIGDAHMIPILDELDLAKNDGRYYDTSSLVAWFSSGVRWSSHLKKRLLEYVPHLLLFDAYGSTEAGIGLTSVASSAFKDITGHTTSSTIDGFGGTVRKIVLDLDTGKPAQPGCKRAQILYGGFMGLGYWKSPSKTKKDFVTINGERYLVVGDEGFVDEHGRFHLLGRGGGYVINTGGEKVYSEEVEEIIKSHPKINDAAVIGIPDERWGEAVTAIIELKSGEKATEDEIKEYCRERMASYKIPKNIIIHSVLRTDVGKINRRGMADIVFKSLKNQNKTG